MQRTFHNIGKTNLLAGKPHGLDHFIKFGAGVALKWCANGGFIVARRVANKNQFGVRASLAKYNVLLASC